MTDAFELYLFVRCFLRHLPPLIRVHDLGLNTHASDVLCVGRGAGGWPLHVGLRMSVPLHRHDNLFEGARSSGVR